MKIREAIQKLAKQDVYESVLGVVISVDEPSKTCTVQPVDDLPIMYGVRLSAVEHPGKGIVAIPTIESYVVVGQTATEQPHVIMFSELDSYSMLFEDVEFSLDENGLKLSVGVNDLKEGIQDLKNALTNLKVMTSQGQSSIPINILDINNACDKIIGTLQ